MPGYTFKLSPRCIRLLVVYSFVRQPASQIQITCSIYLLVSCAIWLTTLHTNSLLSIDRISKWRNYLETSLTTALSWTAMLPAVATYKLRLFQATSSRIVSTIHTCLTLENNKISFIFPNDGQYSVCLAQQSMPANQELLNCRLIGFGIRVEVKINANIDLNGGSAVQ